MSSRARRSRRALILSRTRCRSRAPRSSLRDHDRCPAVRSGRSAPRLAGDVRRSSERRGSPGRSERRKERIETARKRASTSERRTSATAPTKRREEGSRACSDQSVPAVQGGGRRSGRVGSEVGEGARRGWKTPSLPGRSERRRELTSARSSYASARTPLRPRRGPTGRPKV